MYRWFSEEDRLDWYRVLPNFLRALNATKSRATGLAPNQIGDHNATEVWERLYGESARQPFLSTREWKRMLRVGDFVRIKNPLEVFDRGYFPRFSDHIYRIVEVHWTRPEYYTLTDDYGERVRRRFYRPELVKIRRD